MLDINLIRQSPELIKKNCEKRGYDKNLVDKILKSDETWRGFKVQADKLRHERNKISEQINQAKKAKDEKHFKNLITRAKEIPKKLEKLQDEEKEIKEQLDSLLLQLPNIINDSVPLGDETKGKTIKTHGKKGKFHGKTHWEIGSELGILDLDAAAKLSGSGFYVLKGDGARLQRSLVQFMLDFHEKNGFEEINGPQIVLPEILIGTGQLPKFENDLYKTREGHYLIPTAEVPVTNLFREETLNEKSLPKKFCSFTQCYRTEAGRHGKETRGIFRLHEFEKVELVYISNEEDSWKFLEEMTRYAEKILEALRIPYRRVLLASQDTGFASAKTYDLEVWSPALKKYIEISSCSNCLDFQARRMNTRYQSKNGLKFVHTLNGSALALPRLMISIMENHQNKNGTINIPKVLQKYMGKKIIGNPKTKIKKKKSKKVKAKKK